jgi:hypothetical protein
VKFSSDLHKRELSLDVSACTKIPRIFYYHIDRGRVINETGQLFFSATPES